MLIFAIYCLLGILVGLLSGLLGIGGGLLVIPALLWIFTQQGIDYGIIMHVAIGTSLATIIFTSLASIHAFHRQGEITWKQVRAFLPGISTGVIVGVIIAHFLSTQNLKVLFGLFVMVVAFHLLFQKEKQTDTKALQHALPLQKKRRLDHAIGLTTGLFSGLLGLGGSIIIIPYCLHQGFTMRQASGISISCTLPMAIIAVCSIIYSSWDVPQLPPFSTGYVNWTAVIGVALPSLFSITWGARLGKRLPQTLLRRFFGVFLIFISVDMLFVP